MPRDCNDEDWSWCRLIMVEDDIFRWLRFLGGAWRLIMVDDDIFRWLRFFGRGLEVDNG